MKAKGPTQDSQNRLRTPSFYNNPIIQTMEFIVISCFFANRAALRSQNKEVFARNQGNVSEFSELYTCGLLFLCSSIIKL
jgi:hypothetical protein